MKPEIKEAWRQANPTERKLDDLEAFEEGYHWGEDAMRERAERLDEVVAWIRNLHETWHQRWLATDRRGTVAGVSASLLASVLGRIDAALAAPAEKPEEEKRFRFIVDGKLVASMLGMRAEIESEPKRREANRETDPRADRP